MTTTPSFDAQVAELEQRWVDDARWSGIRRGYTAAEVLRLRGSFTPECTIARRGAERLWKQLHEDDYVHALGAMTGGQAVQMVKAGLPAIYLSGWQVAGDANLSEQVYPDQSLYPANSVPAVVRRINNALRRADQIEWSENGGRATRDWMVPIVADAEAGFGGPLNAFELMKSMIEAGAAGVHWEDQLSSEKKCGHMGGKVLIPTQQHIRTLIAARLAADVMDVPTIVVARTDALGATLITSDVDERDREFLTGERTAEGFFMTQPILESPIKRALAYAPYADLIWCETSTPDLDEARRFAEAVKARVSRQDAGVQLLAVVQLAQVPRRLDHRPLPEGARCDGLRLPVHHPRRLARAQPVDVRVGPRLQRRRHDRLRRTADTRVRVGGRGLHRHPPPTRSRRRLLRRRRIRHLRRQRIDARAQGLHRRRPIPLTDVHPTQGSPGCRIGGMVVSVVPSA